MKITKTTQLVVLTPDRPGQLAAILGPVSKAKINVLAYAGYTQAGRGHVMLVTEQNAKAAAVLKKAGFRARSEPVVVFVAGDVVGSGARIAAKIAKAGVSLKQAYATGAGGKYLTVLQGRNNARLVAALR